MTDGSGKSVQLWDADTGKELRNFSKDRLCAVAFHPNDKQVAGVVHDEFNVTAGSVKVWDITSGREVVSFRAHKEFPRNMATSSDGGRGNVIHGLDEGWNNFLAASDEAVN